MAMSGGVDSTASAIILMREGYSVEGVTFRGSDCALVGSQVDGKLQVERRGEGQKLLQGELSEGELSAGERDAARAAERLGIPHHVIDLREPFSRHVRSYFIDEYLHGRTPNPCVECNAFIKWGELLRVADELGCQYLATGHYARIGCEEGRYFICRGADESKDQSYFLWRLTSEHLSRTIFPLGGMRKSEAREIVCESGLEWVSKRRESQEICFVPDDDYREFLRQNVENFEERFCAGNFVDREGHILGEHKGFPNYTIGQRKRLGIALGEPRFVLEIRADRNEVVLGGREDLLSSRFVVKGVNSAKCGSFEEGMRVMVKVRYRSRAVPAVLHSLSEGDSDGDSESCSGIDSDGASDGASEGRLGGGFDCGFGGSLEGSNARVEVELLSPLDSITPGQSAVFYDDSGALLGGGVII